MIGEAGSAARGRKLWADVQLGETSPWGLFSKKPVSCSGYKFVFFFSDFPLKLKHIEVDILKNSAKRCIHARSSTI